MLNFRIRFYSWVGCLLAVTAVAVVGQPASGQSTVQAPSARQILQKAHSAFRNADYEAADTYFRKVQIFQNELSPTERQELSAGIFKNSEALKQQRLGRAQINQAEDALNKGDLSKARSLLNLANANKYLTAKDRARMASLAKGRPQPQTPVNQPQTNKQVRIAVPKTWGYDKLLSEARASLNRGQPDTAEQLAYRAKQVNTGIVPTWMRPLSDTPEKVLRDVQIVRQQQAMAKAKAQAKRPIKTVRNIFPKKQQPQVPAKQPVAKPQPKQPQPKQPQPLPFVQGKPKNLKTDYAKPQPIPFAQGKQPYAKVKQPFTQVKQPYTKAKFGKPSGIVQTGFQPGGNNTEDVQDQARTLVKQGYDAMKSGDFEKARQLAEQARQLNAGLPFYENNPEKLLAEIEKNAPIDLNPQPKVVVPNLKPNPPKVVPKVSPLAEAKALVKKGKELLEKGDLDQAEKLCNQAAAITGANWGLFDYTPSRLRTEILSARNRENQKQARTFLAQARKLLADGQLEQAKELAWKAKKLRGNVGIYNFGDNPDALLKEIHAAELAQSVPPRPKTNEIANNNTGKSGSTIPLQPFDPNKKAPTIPSVDAEKNLAKQKVVSLLKEVRDLQTQGKLIEARERAVTAQKAGMEARKLGVVFAPNEDNPGLALLQLGIQCRQQLDQLDKQATDMVSKNANDPNRFQKAMDLLNQAQALAKAFNQDAQPITQRMQWAQQMQSIANGQVPAPPTNPLVDNANPLTQKGLAKLEGARQYLRSGHTLPARKIVEEVMDPKYGLQKEAMALLNSIDTEESNQRRLANINNFESMRDAFNRQNYAKAFALSRSVDYTDLPPAYQERFQEIMSTPAMQNPMVADSTSGTKQQTMPPAVVPPIGIGPKAKIGKVTIGDTGPLTKKDQFPQQPKNPLADYQAREKLLFQKLRYEGAEVLSKAREAFSVKDHAVAIQLLSDYNQKVASLELDPKMVASLQRPVQSRLEQYRAAKKDEEFFEIQRAKLKDNAFTREQARQMQKRNRDEKIRVLMEEFRKYYHAKDFEKAKLIAKQALALNPNNEAAGNGLEMATLAGNLATFRSDEANNAKLVQDELRLNLGPHAGIGNGHEPMIFDREHWKRVQEHRKYDPKYQRQRVDPVERSIESELLKPVHANFSDTPLGDALDSLHLLTGVTIIPNTRAIRDAGISLDQRLNLQVEGMTLKSTLYHLLDKVNLTYVIKEQALEITTKENAQGRLVTVTYPVGDLVIAVPDTTKAPMPTLDELLTRFNSVGNYGGPYPFAPQNGLRYGAPVGSNSTYNSPGNGSGYGSGPNSGFASAGPNGTGGGYSLNQPPGSTKKTIEDQLIKLVTTTIAPESWADVGGKGTIQYFPLGLGLVVNQTQDVQEQVFDLLQALRRLQDLEVAIEIRLISVSESFFEYIGVDFDINITTHNQRFQEQLVSQQFQPFGINRPLPNGFFSGLTPAGTFTPDLNIPLRSSSFDYTIPQLGGFPGALGADGGLALGLAFLSDIQVFMFMEAAAGDRRANTMQAPRVTVFNGQQATLSVNDVVPFLLNIQPTFAGDQLYFIPTQIGLPLGTQIFVTPVVSADRRFVRLSLNQSMTNLVSANVPLIPIQIPVFAQFFDGITATQPQIFQIFLQQPSTANIFVQTTVTVPDGGTVLLGGLKALTEQRSEFGPPIISQIPYVNRLFKNVGYGREASSLMMMVTPRIIINEEEELIFLEELPPIPRGNFP